MFVNRDEELGFLEKHFRSQKPELLVIYGRRRVGKTELLRRFCRGKETAFFIGYSASGSEHIKKFQEVAAEELGDPEIAALKPDWELVFKRIASKKGRIIVVIDEFPFLALSDRTLTSRLLRIWELYLRNSRIFLVLCGSSVSMMEREVLAYKSPLYGRRTGQWRVEPFQFRELKKFFPDKDWEEIVRIYSIAGGVPFYLQYFSGRGLEDVVANEFFNKGQMLYSEGEILLKEELREPATYFTILKALSMGKTRLSDLMNETGMPKTHISKYLAVLQSLGFVVREVPVTEKNPARSRLGLYFISDNYLNFWFKFIYPNASEIEMDRAAFARKVVRSELNAFVGRAFEKIGIQILAGHLAGKGMRVDRLGRWWDRQEEIDAVGLNEEERRIFFCECKWSELALREAREIIARLREKAKRVEWNAGKRKETYCLIAKKIHGKEELRRDGLIALDLLDLGR